MIKKCKKSIIAMYAVWAVIAISLCVVLPYCIIEANKTSFDGVLLDVKEVASSKARYGVQMLTVQNSSTGEIEMFTHEGDAFFTGHYDAFKVRHLLTVGSSFCFNVGGIETNLWPRNVHSFTTSPCEKSVD